jgi:hypothetical protein
VLLLGLAAGCGGTDPSTTPEPAETPHVTISTPTPTPTPAVSPTPTPTPRPTATPTQGDQGGNGDADETAGPATAGGGICGRLSAEEVGRVLGGTVKGKALGGLPGCSFTQADARAYAATLTPAKSMAAARDEATSAVEGTPQSVPGVGAEAFVVTGTMFGGEDVQAAGAVRVGTQVVSVALSQEKGLPAAQVRDRLVALLRLVVSQSG